MGLWDTIKELRVLPERPSLGVVDGVLRYGPGDEHVIRPPYGGGMGAVFVSGWPHKRDAHKYWLVDDAGLGYRLCWLPSAQTIEDFEATADLCVWSGNWVRPDEHED